MRLWTGSATALALAGLLAGCNRAPDSQTAANDAVTAAALPALPQALPMQAGAAGVLATAPPASALRANAPVQVAALPSPGDAYAYLDRAVGQSDAYGDAPPDYAFDYDGVSPWAWQAGDGSTEYAEPVDGGYRSYYYEPGQDQPYLVRDGDYSYAYAGAALVAIYLGGRLLRHEEWGDRARYAAGYRDRAENLYRASRDDRRGVVAADWAARRRQVAQQRDSWAADRARQADWASYHREHAAAEQDHWAQDRQQRAVAARQFDDWHQQGYRGPAPYARPAPSARRAPDHPPETRLPPGRPIVAPTPDRREDRPQVANGRLAATSPAADRRAPPERAEPAARPASTPAPAPVPNRRVAPPETARRPMLGSDPQRMRERGGRPLEAPLHEPQRAEARVEPARIEPARTLPARTVPRVSYGERRAPITRDPIVRDPIERAPVAARPTPHIEAPRATPERPQPHIEAPRAIPEHAIPHAEPQRPAPHVEAPHEAPHVAPPHASEANRGERPR